jgi:hypothetical protein
MAPQLSHSRLITGNRTARGSFGRFEHRAMRRGLGKHFLDDEDPK